MLGIKSNYQYSYCMDIFYSILFYSAVKSSNGAKYKIKKAAISS